MFTHKTMPRELIILRHCKSDWDNNHHQDGQRPLSQRGVDNAKKIGEWLRKKSMFPELVLCSTAVRAQQTLNIINVSLNVSEHKIQLHKGLYLASMATLQNYLRKVDSSCQSVMVVGHNPGLDYLVDHISKQKPSLTNSGKLMTTGCIAHFECPDNWRALEHCGRLLSLTRPDDID